MAGQGSWLFTPGRMIWTVDREAVLLLGGGRALLLQLAHPLVAAGVDDHSGFMAAPYQRLSRTLDTTYTIVFGDADSAMAALRRMEAVHRSVRGVLPEPAGPFPAGTRYDASDPALRLWVHATLVDTSLLVYDRLVAHLSAAEQAQYYAESRDMARALGIPEPMIPATLEQFRTYVAGMLATEIAVGATARALARLIFRPPRAMGLRMLGPLSKFVAVGLLPPAVRVQYGYRWNPVCERALETLARALRTTLPAVPAVIRGVPQARAAELRLGSPGPGRRAA